MKAWHTCQALLLGKYLLYLHDLDTWIINIQKYETIH